MTPIRARQVCTATIDHMTASIATRHTPNTSKKLRFNVAPSLRVANAYTPSGKVKAHQPD
ncbi:hypothetical protein PSA5_09670 [Pseudomonas syringae pv. actinidiae]|nr:hypothetical protein PSA5_09670 [Pseudomonas syringae pv. actinidiae]